MSKLIGGREEGMIFEFKNIFFNRTEVEINFLVLFFSFPLGGCLFKNPIILPPPSLSLLPDQLVILILWDINDQKEEY